MEEEKRARNRFRPVVSVLIATAAVIGALVGWRISAGKTHCWALR